MSKKIAIIGGGAAGLMAAATLAESETNLEVTLFEKNPHLGAKVIISGGGRCNVTTGIHDRKTLLTKYTRGAQFLKSALGKFPPPKVMAWFEDHGVPLKTEEDLRVFPVSNNGKDIVGVFEKIFQKRKINVHLKESIQNITPFSENEIKVTSNKRAYTFNHIILTTGGNAYRQTGSTGDGYAFAKSFNHTITPLGPSLNSFLTLEEWPKKISGVSLPNALVSATAEDGERKTATGPILFTHFGLTGPAVFALSSHLAFTKISDRHPLPISIQPLATHDHPTWNNTMITHFEEHGTQQISTFLKSHLPNRFAETLLEISKINPQKKNCEVSKQERQTLTKLLSGNLTLTTTQRRPGDEFVTAGGVELSEVDKKTLQSKLHPGLSFGGEILNIDGVTGGFNLQASWATGRLAALHILNK